MSFENLIGNYNVKEELKEAIKNNKIVHSYMFVGQEGIGKKKYALEFAKKLLCLSNNKDTCNNTCESCIKFNSNNHPDFFYVEPEGNSLKISQVRTLQESIYQKPIISNKKIYIINDANKMTVEAQNAFLKTLEEPPEYAVIILIVSNENMLLNTIKSRCLRVYFNSIEQQEFLQYIKKNNIIENPSDSIIEMCGGSFSRLENIKENYDKYSSIEEIFTDFINKKEKSIINIFNKFDVLYKKEDIQNLLEYMIVIIYNLIKTEGYKKRYISAINIIENCRKKISSNCNFDMCIDELLLKLYEI